MGMVTETSDTFLVILSGFLGHVMPHESKIGSCGKTKRRMRVNTDLQDNIMKRYVSFNFAIRSLRETKSDSTIRRS